MDQYKQGTDAMIESQGALLKSQQESTSEIAKQGEMLKAQAELDKQAALLKLQQGYLLAMSGATSPEQRESIDRRYKASQADIEGQTTVNVANLEAQEAAAKAKAAQDQLREQQEDYAKNRKTVDDAQQQKMDADAVFAKYGVIAPRNDKGELSGALTSPATGVTGVPFTGKSASSDVIGDLKEKISDLGLTIAGLENEANEPVPTMWRLHESQDQREKDWKENREDYRKTYQVDDLKTQWRQMQTELEDLQNALKTAAQSQAVLGDNELHKKIQEAPDQMFQSGVGVTNAQREADQKAQAAQLAAQKMQQDAQQRKQENDRAEEQARQEQLRTWRDNELNAQKLRLQGQLETAPESGKAGIQAQLAGIDNQEAINKANDKLGFLIHPPAAANNPYGGGFDELNKRLDQLQNQQEANPAAAKYLDPLIQQVAKNLEELKKQSDDWQRSQGERGPALTPEQLARQSIRDLTTAETGFNNARAQGQGQKDAAEVTRQQLQSQQREIEQLKTQIAAREDHTALEPLVKAAVSQMYVSTITTTIDPDDPLNDPNKNPNNITLPNCPQLVNELISGHFPPWMQDDPNDLDCALVLISVVLAYNGGDALTAALFTLNPTNPNTPTAPGKGALALSWKVRVTNADTQTYSQITSEDSAEPV